MSYLDNVATANVIPAYASFNEAMYYVIESTEKDYTNMLMNIGLNELAIIESGNVLAIQEAEKNGFQRFIDNIVKFFQTMWGKVKGLFDKCLAGIKTKIDENKKRNLDKKLKKYSDKIDKLPDDKEFGKIFNYNDFSNDNWGKFAIDIEVYSKGCGSVLSFTDVDAAKAQLDRYNENFAKKFIGESKSFSDTAIKDVRKTVVENLRGKEVVINKKYLKDNLNNMCDYVTNYNTTIKPIKSAYNKAKKSFDDTIKLIKSTKEDPENKAQYAIMKEVLAPLKKSKEYMIAACQGLFTVCREKLMKESILLFKLSTSLEKQAKKDEKKEEAKKEEKKEDTSSTVQSEIANLFDWNL